jgi:uncharacterized integral membrane protein (TIGR00698 family)
MQILFPLIALLCLAPFVSAGLALFLGVALAVTLGNPYIDKTRKLTPKLLAWAVMGMGAGMNLGVIGRVGLQGVGYTMAGITLAILLGALLRRLFVTEKVTSVLITVGTAICGGSAIAAVAPVIRARPQEISVSLGTVFLLNAVALFLFPPVGHWLGLSQHQFGLWSALAIHDTSSVVGASMQYGAEALQVGTTVKLARALWIVPVALLAGFAFRNQGSGGAAPKAKKPWFILGFLAAAALVTWVPALQPSGQFVSELAKRLMVLTLFLIGASMNRAAVKSVGPRPFLLGLSLWIIVGSGTLGAILAGWIR